MELALLIFSGSLVDKAEVNHLKIAIKKMQHDSAIEGYHEVCNVICCTPYNIHLFYLYSQFDGLYRHFLSLGNLWEADKVNERQQLP